MLIQEHSSRALSSIIQKGIEKPLDDEAFLTSHKNGNKISYEARFVYAKLQYIYSVIILSDYFRFLRFCHEKIRFQLYDKHQWGQIH